MEDVAREFVSYNFLYTKERTPAWADATLICPPDRHPERRSELLMRLPLKFKRVTVILSPPEADEESLHNAEILPRETPQNDINRVFSGVLSTR